MTAPLVIYCDASAPHPNADENHNSGWGAVFVRSGEVVAEACGSMPKMESVVAELKAVRHALDYAVRAGLCACETVIVASDCDAVSRYLDDVPRNKARGRRLELLAISDGVRRVAAKANLVLVATWVKGHRPSAELHGRHNSRADRLAREASGSVAARQRRAAERHAENERRQKELSVAIKARKAAEKAARPSARAVKIERVLAVAARLEGRS